jgi:hypothetical protein
MKSQFVLKLLVIFATLMLTTAVFAQCVPVIPQTLTVGQSVCITVCNNVFANPAIQLYGSNTGPAAKPVLILEAGCMTAHCDQSCTPVTPPPYSSFVLGGDPYYPDNYYAHNSCFYMYLYWIHDNVWALEIYTTCSGCFCLTYDSQLPVNLQSDLAAIPGDNQITLTWATASETNSDHFDLMRDGTLAGRVDGLGNSATGKAYSWTDNAATNGVMYRYDLVSVDASGGRQILGHVSASPNVGAAHVTEYALLQNYPNPFNPSTSISFDVVESNYVTLRIFNPLGECVATLMDGNVGAGRHSVTFDGSKFTSGLYFYSIKIGNHFSATRKMLLVK